MSTPQKRNFDRIFYAKNIKKRREQMRKAQRRFRAKHPGRKQELDQNWRDNNRVERNIAIRCGVTIKVARRWIRDGKVPPRKIRTPAKRESKS